MMSKEYESNEKYFNYTEYFSLEDALAEEADPDDPFNWGLLPEYEDE